jgi:hypothetical protein
MDLVGEQMLLEQVLENHDVIDGDRTRDQNRHEFNLLLSKDNFPARCRDAPPPGSAAGRRPGWAGRMDP